jgi:hypothetical protein
VVVVGDGVGEGVHVVSSAALRGRDRFAVVGTVAVLLIRVGEGAKGYVWGFWFIVRMGI